MNKLRALVIFSNPPDKPYLRLDREEKQIAALLKRFPTSVEVVRLHASDTDDIHESVVNGGFDLIQFSGHGDRTGIYLESRDYRPGAELVSAERLRSLLALADRSPNVVILLSCFADEVRATLADVAPFVVSALGEVPDDACLCFIQGLYERLFAGYGVSAAFEHGVQLLRSRKISDAYFRLDRRALIQRERSKFAEVRPDRKHNSILINLDAVLQRIAELGLSEEQFCHELERKLAIHYWIFDVPRERCVIPIGRLLFGEFSWQNARDVVFCTRLMRLRADIPMEHWRTWHQLLLSYNDLASCEYRNREHPADPTSRSSLAEAVQLFQHHVTKNLRPAAASINELGFPQVLPHIEFVASHVENAQDQLQLERYPQLVKSLEEALTNYHEIVSELCPPEESSAQ